MNQSQKKNACKQIIKATHSHVHRHADDRAVELALVHFGSCAARQTKIEGGAGERGPLQGHGRQEGRNRGRD